MLNSALNWVLIIITTNTTSTTYWMSSPLAIGLRCKTNYKTGVLSNLALIHGCSQLTNCWDTYSMAMPYGYCRRGMLLVVLFYSVCIVFHLTTQTFIRNNLTSTLKVRQVYENNAQDRMEAYLSRCTSFKCLFEFIASLTYPIYTTYNMIPKHPCRQVISRKKVVTTW